jgi:beta-galactosidase
MMTQYVYPQENGNHTDVKWFALTDENGHGIRISGDFPLNFSVWNTTQAELDCAKHIGEPVELESSFVLNVDQAQNGVGGTDSWTKAARPSDQYRLLEKNYKYSFCISVEKKQSNPLIIRKLSIFLRAFLTEARFLLCKPLRQGTIDNV